MSLLGLLHFLLNVTGLLLWLRWREEMLQSSHRGTGATLLSTLKRAGASRVQGWTCLGLLGALVLLRALGYWHMGARLGWNPSLDLGATALSFRSDAPGLMFVFSAASLVVFVVEFHFWLLLLSAANARVPDTDPFQNRLRAHLGWLERLPVALKLLLPFLVAGLFWLGMGPLLARLGYILPARSLSHTLQQAIVIGLAAFMVWKFLIAGILVVHLVTSYVYLGNAPFWSFINATGRNLLAPIHWIPLRLGRLDFVPLLGTAVVLFLGEAGKRWLPDLYGRLPVW